MSTFSKQSLFLKGKQSLKNKLDLGESVTENTAQDKDEGCKNSEAKPHMTNSKTSAPISLDETDRTLLQMLQDDFPIVQEPWLEIGSKVNISEEEVISRLKRLTEAGAILKIGPVFDSSRIGLNAATLVAMRVPKDRVNDVAQVINGYSNVSHNYEREDEFNVWFTLAAPSNRELAKTLDELKQKTGVKEQDVLNLPTVRRFKVNVCFQLT
jgi:DNA-binding Lrp family transcriptional regulator